MENKNIEIENKEIEKINCVICLEEIVNQNDFQIIFFCNCKPNVHKLCYDKFYYSSYKKCFICKKYDIDELSDDLLKLYNGFYDQVRDLMKYNCICSLDGLLLSHNSSLVYTQNNIIIHNVFLNIFDDDTLKEFYIKINDKIDIERKYRKIIYIKLLDTINYILTH